ncbi:myeloperoxidase-like [Haliotis cracherodii]|uniref:myeloperoxidase-like n=1 Tax=Haliotis cracherodii TaxID=6455 RepID=UPI0039E92F92
MLAAEMSAASSGEAPEERRMDEKRGGNVVTELPAQIRGTEAKTVRGTADHDTTDLVTCTLADSSETGQISVNKKSKKKNNGPTRRRRSTLCEHNSRYRQIDGMCNNEREPQWGSTEQPFKRILHSAYEDGTFVPRLTDSEGKRLPSPRLISTRVHRSISRKSSDNTLLVMQWGQFIDHDLTGTPVHSDDLATKCCEGLEPGVQHPDVETGGPCFPIRIPNNDRHFNKSCMEFIRSAAAPGINPREQINLLTAFLDASNVYGLNTEHLNHLRHGPFLKTKGDDLLPESNETICRLEHSTDWCFAAGDDRVNVFPGLTVLHTIFMREHNRLVRELSSILPTGTPDEILFQEAKKIVSAMLQHITYTEWLPIILGSEAMETFKLTPDTYSYDITKNPTIANVFATAAFRYGHSTIPTFLTIDGRRMPISKLFNSPTEVIRDLDAVLEAILEKKRQNVDRFVTDMMTDHLFETSGKNSHDVVSLNIQRGRDHGLPSYNDFRHACNLKQLDTFETAVFGNATSALTRTYSHPRDVDVFSGAVSEIPVKGGSMGPLLACLIGQQFHDIKFGDSFWYETANTNKGFTPEQLVEIKRVKLSKILCLNSGINKIQMDAFNVESKKRNPLLSCCDLPTLDVNKWRK